MQYNAWYQSKASLFSLHKVASLALGMLVSGSRDLTEGAKIQGPADQPA